MTAPHPYLRFLAAWDRDEAGFLAELDALAGRPVRFSGIGCPTGELEDCLAAFLADPMAAVTETQDGTLLLPGNPQRVMRQLLRRHYLPPRRPWWSRVPRPVLRPGALLRRSVGGRQDDSPPTDGGLSWPDDPRVDRYRRDLYQGLVEEREEELPGAMDAPWPGDRRYALCMTYEVASPDGMRRISPVTEEDVSRGLRPAFFLAGRRRLWDSALVEEVRAAGGEIGLLGVDLGPGLAHARPSRIRKALDRAQPLVDRYRVLGYRHRSSRVTPALLEVLGERFAYDNSIPDTARCPVTGVVRGCAITTPFDSGALMELPVTVPPDQTLLKRGIEGLDFLDVIRRKVLAIRERRGVATLTVRLEPSMGARRVQRDLLGALLGELADLDDAWFATPGEVALVWQRAGTRASVREREIAT